MKMLHSIVVIAFNETFFNHSDTKYLSRLVHWEDYIVGSYLSLVCKYMFCMYSKFSDRQTNRQDCENSLDTASAVFLIHPSSLNSLDRWIINYYNVSLIFLNNYKRAAFVTITKTYLYNFDPLKPHFYIVKLGFTGVYIIFLISVQNIDCGYSLEPPRRGGSNEYPQSMF